MYRAGPRVDATLVSDPVRLIAARCCSTSSTVHDAANSMRRLSRPVLRPAIRGAVGGILQFRRLLYSGLTPPIRRTGIIEPSVIARGDRRVDQRHRLDLITWDWGYRLQLHALIGDWSGLEWQAGISAAVWSGLSKTLLAIVLRAGWILLACTGRDRGPGRRSAQRRSRSIALRTCIRLGVDVFARSWRQRSKRHGIIAVLPTRRTSGYGILGAVGGAGVPGSNGAGTLMGGWRIVRPWTRNTKADADAGNLRGNRRRRHAVHGTCSAFRLHTHTSPAPSSASARPAGFGGALERGQFDRLCLGDYHSSSAGVRHWPIGGRAAGIVPLIWFSRAIPI